MTPTTAILLAIFTGLVAVALLLQGLALLAISRKLRDLSAQFDTLSARLTKQVDALTVQAQDFLSVIKKTAERVNAVQDNVAAITKVVYDRAVAVDAFIEEATDAARLQIAKLQDVVETTAGRIDATINTLQDAIIVPVREAQAIVRGIRSGLDVLFRRRALPSRRSDPDEEMFI